MRYSNLLVSAVIIAQAAQAAPLPRIEVRNIGSQAVETLAEDFLTKLPNDVEKVLKNGEESIDTALKDADEGYFQAPNVDEPFYDEKDVFNPIDSPIDANGDTVMVTDQTPEYYAQEHLDVQTMTTLSSKEMENAIKTAKDIRSQVNLLSEDAQRAFKAETPAERKALREALSVADQQSLDLIDETMGKWYDELTPAQRRDFRIASANGESKKIIEASAKEKLSGLWDSLSTKEKGLAIAAATGIGAGVGVGIFEAATGSSSDDSPSNTSASTSSQPADSTTQVDSASTHSTATDPSRPRVAHHGQVHNSRQ